MSKTPKILLDTNVIIYRETDRILNQSIRFLNQKLTVLYL